MTIPVQTLAKFIIQNSDRVSNLKLQKLLYYVQGWHLALKGEPIFTAEIQAWVHGPVTPEVFHLYKHFRWNPIEKPTEDLAMPASIASHTKLVLDAYGKYAASQLEALSHSESPWIDARMGLSPNAPSNAVISHQAMRVYFASKHG
jgi:uncharacterized phage-associated protein